MKKVSGELLIEARVDCPSCGWCNDLFLDHSLNHHNELYISLLEEHNYYNDLGDKDLNVITTCKRCHMPFAVGEIAFN